jgi:hypothetical protein
LIDAILNGSHPIFNRRPQSLFADKDTELYAFLKAASARYPARLPTITNAVLGWFAESPSFMLPSFLGIIKYFIEVHSLPRDSSSSVASQLLCSITGQSEGLDEVLLGILLMLVAEFPDALDRDRLVSQLAVLWQETSSDEISGWRAQLGTGILELCAAGAEMDDEVVLDVLGDFPPNPLFGKTASMVIAICGLVNDTAGKWVGVMHAAAQCLVDGLMLKQEDLVEHTIEPELYENMKVALKRALAATPGLEREIRKGFAKKKPQLTKLDALLK